MNISIIQNLIYPLSNKILRKVNKFENLHKNESCYLIGDGSSVKWFDLHKFNNLISLTVGYIPFHNDYSCLNNPYSLLIEPFWFYENVKTTVGNKIKIKNEIQKKYRDVIDKKKDTNYFLSLSNYPVTYNKKNIFYLYNNIPNSLLLNHFHEKGLNPFYGSMRTSILMAIYMGFQKVYLIGYDYTHSPSRHLHWYEKGQGELSDLENYEKEFFKIANEFIDITTVTIDGISDKVNYITYEKLTGSKPIYKENYDILNMDYLQALSNWPGYSIF